MTAGKESSGHKEYLNSNPKRKSLPVKYKDRETYMKSIEKLSKQSPGPGKYTYNPEEQERSKVVSKKVNFEAEKKKSSMTALDQLILEKKCIPGVGDYELEIDHREEIKKKYSVLGDRARKQAPLFRGSDFDDVKPDCVLVGPGSYRTYQLMGGNKPHHKIDHLQELKKNTELQAKRSKSLPKLPGPSSYTPVPGSYETFDHILSSKSRLDDSDKVKQSVIQKFAKFDRGKRTMMNP